MEPGMTRLGSSIPVPCVQELAKETPHRVPPRYVRPEQDPFNISNNISLPHVPVVDMEKLLYPEFMDSELQKLHCASKDWGFFQLSVSLSLLWSVLETQERTEDPKASFNAKLPLHQSRSQLLLTTLINHGVSTSLLENVKLDIQEFFKLPMEEKKKFWQEPGDVEGFGQAFVVSEDQKLDWGDMYYMVMQPTYLRKPHLFPKLPLPLRDNIESYSMELQNLAMKILELMAKALGMENNDMKNLFEGGMQKMRMNYYPPCPQPELAMGLTPHSDAVGLTILLQLNEMEGLQIKKEGIWSPVKPLPDAFIVNIGDILEIVTNGMYRSIEHRATVNSEKERLSIATFYSPRLEGDLGPAPSLITPESPALFRRIGVADYFRGIFSRKLDGKSYVDVLRIQNEEQKGS